MLQTVRLVMLLWLAILVPTRTATACSCAMPPACSAFYNADAVFIGQAEVVKTGARSQRARFRVEESFRGAASKGGTIEIVGKGIGGSCAYEFVDGSRYLVYATKQPDGTWGAFLCGRTMVVDTKAEADVELARWIARNPSGSGRVAGSASIAERRARGANVSIAPLAKTSITIRSDTQSFTTETDSRGSFEFKDVPPDRYTLTVRLSPQFEAFTPMTITVAGPGACALYGIDVIRRPGAGDSHYSPGGPAYDVLSFRPGVP